MEGTYNLGLVLLSYVVSVLGALAALQLAVGIPSARTGTARLLTIAAAATAMGGGAIWSMHFIAMLAFQMPMPMSYDVGMTLFSAVVAIVSCGVGLAVVGPGAFTTLRLLGGGTFMGVGVASMHYTGMDAMLMPATLQYNMPLLLLSVVIAIAASIVALWLVFHLRGFWQMLCSAPIMGAAVCGMHYTGMVATSYTATDIIREAGLMGAMSGQNLGISIFVVTGVLLGVLLPYSYLRNQEQHVFSL